MKKVIIPTKRDVIQPTRSSLYPTAIKIEQHPGTGAYQWQGNDGHAYSAPNNSLQTVVSVATSGNLRKI